MIEKFDIKTCKSFKKRRKYGNTYESQRAIRYTLEEEAVDYVRKIKKIPYDKICWTYKTKQGKVAVIALDTPRKRLEYKKAWHACNGYENSDAMKDFRERYGFIPKPINVLRKYVEYGCMESQDVEHIYHNLQVDYKISDNKDEMMAAYNICLEEKDVLVDGFNGYSCMSNEEEVGAFYYYFGAYMLIFYDEGTTRIVGRMVLWKWKDQLYCYKGYVDTQHQFSAKAVVDKLLEDGTLKKGLPVDFYTELQRIEGKTPAEIFNIVGDWVRVPYIDEDLCLSEDKIALSFSGSFETKRTDCQTLWDYSKEQCSECGDLFDPDDIVWCNDEPYCTYCANHCQSCDDWVAPYVDGCPTRDGWVCEDCKESYYEQCEKCDDWVNKEEGDSIKDEYGDWIWLCDDCIRKYCKTCESCGNKFIPKDSETKCKWCLDDEKEEVKND